MSHPGSPSSACKRRGFTMVELLIAMVVIGIITALAFPSFLGSIRKSRRAEAYAALSAVQLKQERWRASNSTYASNLTGSWPTSSPPTASNGLALPAATASNYYAIAIPAGSTNETNYEATATAVAGSSQVSDGECAILGVKMVAGNLSYGSAPSSGTLAYGPTNPCWSR